MAVALLFDLYQLVPQWLGLELPRLDIFTYLEDEMLAMRSPRHALSVLVLAWHNALLRVFILVTFLVLLTMLTMAALQRLVARRVWRALGVGVWLVLCMIMIQPGGSHMAFDVGFTLAILAIFTLVLLRFGFLSAITGIALMRVASALPLTLDLSAWWARGSFLALVMIAVVVGWGIMAALAGRAALQPAEGGSHG
jgi:hypothetical protein